MKLGLYFALGICCFFLHQKALSAVFEVAYEAATAFYKSPDSLFASGHASKSDLLSSVRQSFTVFQFEARSGNKTVQVSNDQVLREINTAWKVQVKRSTPLYKEADLTSRKLIDLSENKTLEVEAFEGAFARVLTTEGKLRGFVLTTSLEIPVHDPGQWVPMLPLSLKHDPKDQAPQKLLISPLMRLKLVQVQGDFGLFSTGHQRGWARLSDVVGRADFAELAWDSVGRKWEKVLYRLGPQVMVVPNTPKPISHFTAFKGAKNRALISGDHISLSRGSRVELVKPQAIRWTQSEVKGHGLVWWRKDLLSEQQSSSTITTQELLKRNLSGMSYDSKRKKGLASAQGIFITIDGKNWKKIPQFGDDDWPVCLHPSGVWFVGTYRSADEGKSFEPFLRYSDLARLLQKDSQRNRAFTHLKVLDVQPLAASQVLMKIDTGLTIAKLTAHVLSSHWKISK
jgi:hypothetical protein